MNAISKEKKIRIHVALQKRKGLFVVYFGKRHWKSLGLTIGDPFELQLQEDTTKYGIEMPEALQEVLYTDPEANAILSKLTDGRKRGLIYFIRRYKSTQTQVNKALMISNRLKMGMTALRELTKKQ